MKPSKEDVVKTFNDNSVVIVNFNKANGDKRIMTCTTSPALIPTQPPKKTDAIIRPTNPNVHIVWDVEAKGYRSFRYDTVNSIHGEPVVLG